MSDLITLGLLFIFPLSLIGLIVYACLTDDKPEDCQERDEQ